MEEKNTVAEELYLVEHWRERFDGLKNRAAGFTRKQLAAYDGFFLTAIGKDAVRNVKDGKAGLEPTRKVVKALEKLIEARNRRDAGGKFLAKRQKLVVR